MDAPTSASKMSPTPNFKQWLTELMGAVTDFSSASAYTAEDFALFGYSVGDGGQLLGERPAAKHAGHSHPLGRSAEASTIPNT